jgi:Protein of unknown function (DUF2939)
MKRRGFLGIGLPAVVLLLGFYVAWPAWSGYTIRNALQTQNAQALAAKVDFDQLRASLRPAVTAKVGEGFDRYQAQLGPTGGLILGQFKNDAIPKIVEASLRTLLTPEMMIRIASEAGPIKETIERVMREQMGRGLPAAGLPAGDGAAGADGGRGLGARLGRIMRGGNQPAESDSPAAPAEQPKRKFSLANIKSFAFNGPLSFQVGLAKDPAAGAPDVTAQMSFTGGDWKLTGLVPRL